MWAVRLAEVVRLRAKPLQAGQPSKIRTACDTRPADAASRRRRRAGARAAPGRNSRTRPHAGGGGTGPCPRSAEPGVRWPLHAETALRRATALDGRDSASCRRVSRARPASPPRRLRFMSAGMPDSASPRPTRADRGFARAGLAPSPRRACQVAVPARLLGPESCGTKTRCHTPPIRCLPRFRDRCASRPRFASFGVAQPFAEAERMRDRRAEPGREQLHPNTSQGGKGN